MMAGSPLHAVTSDRVPFGEKVALGVGGLTAFFGFAGPERLAWPVLGMMLGVDGWLIGVSLLIPRVWDALTDPLMGRISDNARTRFGRRRPFVLIGALFMGLSFVAMWYLPQGASDRVVAAWFVGAQIIFFTAYTVFSVPFTALSYEMTPDHHERTRVMASIGFFHKLGELLSGWMPALIGVLSVWLVVNADGMEFEGVHATAWLIGVVVFVVLGAVPALFVRERFTAPPRSERPVKLTEGFGAALSSRAFLVLVAVIVFNTLAGILASGIDQFLLVYYMNGGDAAAGLVQKGVLTSGYAVVGFASIPVITWLGERLGKKGTLYFVYGLTFVGALAKWFIFTPGDRIVSVLGVPIDPVLLIDPLLCGPMWVAVKILLASMMADICDEDELRHGQRREGLFGAAFSWIEKLVVSLAALATGLALTISGFDADLGADQGPGTFATMRSFLVGGPAVTALLAIVALRLYPIDAQRAASTRAALEERRGRVDAVAARVEAT
ncbi:MAG: MFS transporter [Planctomycetota bacterium]